MRKMIKLVKIDLYKNGIFEEIEEVLNQFLEFL